MIKVSTHIKTSFKMTYASGFPSDGRDSQNNSDSHLRPALSRRVENLVWVSPTRTHTRAHGRAHTCTPLHTRFPHPTPRRSSRHPLRAPLPPAGEAGEGVPGTPTGREADVEDHARRRRGVRGAGKLVAGARRAGRRPWPLPRPDCRQRRVWGDRADPERPRRRGGARRTPRPRGLGSRSPGAAGAPPRGGAVSCSSSPPGPVRGVRGVGASCPRGLP